MAKTSIWQRLKSGFRNLFGGGKSTPSKTKSSAVVRSTPPALKSSSATYSRRALLDSLKEDEKKKPETKSAYKAADKSYEDMTASLKKDVPKDPKIVAAEQSRERARARLKKIDDWSKGVASKTAADDKLYQKEQERKTKREEERKAFNKATDNRYNFNTGDKQHDQEAWARVMVNPIVAQRRDSALMEQDMERNPLFWSGIRGASNGASFGAVNLGAALLPQDEEARKAEAIYQANKNPWAEMGGELVGSMASFGATSPLTEQAGAKVASKLFPNLGARLAENGLVKWGAERAVNKAVKKGLVGEATELLVKQVGKDKAAKIVSLLGEDIVQNLTTGLIYDINSASTNYEIGSKEWWQDLARSAEINFGVTGLLAGGKMLGGNKRLAVNAANELADLGMRQSAAKNLIFDRANQADNALATANYGRVDINSMAQPNPQAWRNDLVATDNLDDFIHTNAQNNKGFYDWGGSKETSHRDIENLWYETRIKNSEAPIREVSIEEATDIAREGIPQNYLSGWFRSADSGYKPKLMYFLSGNGELRNAGYNIAYHNYASMLDDPAKALPFDEWINTPQKMYRGTRGQKTIDDDIFSAFTPDRKVAEKFAGKGDKAHIEEITVRPIDTFGSFQTNGELEYLVPQLAIDNARAADVEAVEKTLVNEATPEVKAIEDTLINEGEVNPNIGQRSIANEAEIRNIGEPQAGGETVSGIADDVSRRAGVDNGDLERIADATGDTGRRGGNDVLRISPENRAKLTENGVTDTRIADVSENYATFSTALDDAKAANNFGGWVDSQSVEDLTKSKARTFLSGDGLAGIAVKEDGDICGVFKNPASKNKGALYDLVYTARANGGTKMDCFGKTLTNSYEAVGYTPVAKIPFNPKHVKDARLLAEQPDVYVLMKNMDDLDTVASKIRKPESAGGYHRSTQAELDKLPLFKDYDEAMKYRDNLLAKQEGGEAIEKTLINEPAPANGVIKEPPKKGGRPAEQVLADNEALFKEADEHADNIRAELDKAKAAKGKKKPPKQSNADDVSKFAGANDEVPDMGFSKGGDEVASAEAKVEAEVNKSNLGKSKLDKLKDKSYKGTGLSTDGVEKMSVDEQRQFFDAERRTVNEHTRRGFPTIAITGDKGFKGVAYDAVKNGETIIDVYHDKDNLAAGAERIYAAADKDGGIDALIKDFNEFANGTRKLDSKQMRNQLYDVIVAVDFANANKNEPWAKDLYLAACKAGAEQVSVSGLSMRMWRQMAMSSPEHRAKAVRQQIVDIFNRSGGMRKFLGKGKGDKIALEELDDILKKNPALQKTLEQLEKMGAATSVDEVNKVASQALLEARKAMPMTAFDQLTQWRYVAMLSSPTTHIRNVTSNVYSATLGQLRDAIGSGVQDGIKEGRGNLGRKFQEAVKAGKIDASNYHKSAGGMSWKVFTDSHVGTKTGFTYDRLMSKIEKTNLELEATPASDVAKIERLKSRLKDLEARSKTAKKEFDEAVAKLDGSGKEAWDSWRTMGKDKLVAAAEKWEHRQYGGKVSKGVFKINDKLSDIIGNALETSDAMSLERIYREKFDKILRANNFDELSRLAKNGDEAAEKQLKALKEYASQEAAYTAALDTYRNYNQLSTALNRYIQDSLFNYDAPIYKKAIGAGLHAVFPFTKVPVNLMKRGLDYSPYGLIRSKVALTKAIEAGDVTAINRACERLAEGRIGTGIVMLGAGLGFLDPDGDLIIGRLHDSDYIDKKKKDAGYQNYSVTLGDKNFTLDWATPTAASLFTGVEFGRMLRNTFGSRADSNGLRFNAWKALDVPIILASTALEPTMQLGVFQGINDTLENVVKSDNYSDSGTNVNPALQIVQNIAQNYINSQITPAIFGSITRAMSPYDYFVTGDTDAEYAFNQQLAKTPFLSNKFLGAKTNAWGQIKNEKTDAGDYIKAAALTLSPARVNKVTWDDTDEYLANFYKKTGDENSFPKNNYKSDFEVGRILGDHPIHMTNKEMAEYNVQRGKAGSDAMADVLDTVVFNRFDKDAKGHRTIPHASNISEAEKKRLIAEFDGKGIKDVVAWVIKQPAYQSASVAEQKQILATIYGTNSGGGDEAKGAKRSSERYIATKKGMSADDYDYYNETPRGAQEALKPYIESGLLTTAQALAFTRGAGKTYYTTDERGEKGGTVVTHYNKAQMMEYLANAGLTYEQSEALYNAFKNANAKDFNGIDLSSGSGRRGYGGYRRHGGRGGSKKAPAIKKSLYKASARTYKDMAATLQPRSSSSKVNVGQRVKVAPPTVKFKKYEV